MPSIARRLLRPIVLVPALLAIAACEQDPVRSQAEPTFARMVLTLSPTGGGQPRTVELTRLTGAVSGPLTVPATGGSVTAAFLNVDGSPDRVLQTYPGDFETRIAVTAGTDKVTVARTSTHTLTINRLAAGAATARVSLHDVAHDREVFGTNVTLEVQ